MNARIVNFSHLPAATLRLEKMRSFLLSLFAIAASVLLCEGRRSPHSLNGQEVPMQLQQHDAQWYLVSSRDHSLWVSRVGGTSSPLAQGSSIVLTCDVPKKNFTLNSRGDNITPDDFKNVQWMDMDSNHRFRAIRNTHRIYTHSVKYATHLQGRLSISDVQTSDGHSYFCVVSTKKGHFTHTVTLNVEPHCSKKDTHAAAPENETLLAADEALVTVKLSAPEGAVCSTRACKHIASQILENMDDNVDPCDNFYRFACGGYLKKAVIPDDEPFIATSSTIEEQMNKDLEIILTTPSLPTDSKVFDLPKNLYATCMNTSKIEAQGVRPLLTILEKLGGWPVLKGNHWRENTFDWIQATYNLRGLNFDTGFFFLLFVDVDPSDSARRILTLGQSALGLDRAYLIKGLQDETVRAYHKYMVDAAVALGANRESAESQLRQALEFEIELAKINAPEEEIRDPVATNNPMTIAELSRKYPSIPWTTYINRLLRPTQVNDTEVVIVYVPSFIQEFERLIRRTPKRTQANYIFWRIVQYSVEYLSEALSTAEDRFTAALEGVATREPRWKQCVKTVAETLPESLGALYVRKHFNRESKQSITELVDNIKEQLDRALETADWMDEGTRTHALAKTAAMKSSVAYPDELLDDRKVEEVFGGWEMSDSSYLQAMLDAQGFRKAYVDGLLRKPTGTDAWFREADILELNAYYVGQDNTILLKAAILQGVYFSKDRPRYVNYGGIGYAIGHEMTHGFDDQGREYDENGNVVEWWAPAAAAKYEEKARCLEYQYGNYTADGTKLDGRRTRGENIADNGGLKMAYRAYAAWAARNGEEQRLPGIPYSPRQMVWLSAANSWCTLERPESTLDSILTDVHSLPEFRIVGTLSNMPEFAEDFKCPVGSKMNPEKKCAVW